MYWYNTELEHHKFAEQVNQYSSCCSRYGTELKHCEFAEQVNQHSSCCTNRCMSMVLSWDIAKLLSYYDVCQYEKTQSTINNNNWMLSVKLNLISLANPINEMRVSYCLFYQLTNGITSVIWGLIQRPAEHPQNAIIWLSLSITQLHKSWLAITEYCLAL